MAFRIPMLLLSSITQYVRQSWQQIRQAGTVFDDSEFHAERHQRFFLLAKTARYIIPVAVIVNMLRLIAEIQLTTSLDTEITYAVFSNTTLIFMYVIVVRSKMVAAIGLITLLAYSIILFNAWIMGEPHLPLGYLAILPIIGTTLLSMRLTLVLSGINIAALTVFRLVAADTMTWANYADWLTFLVLMGLIFLLYTYIHLRLASEHTRMIAMQERNAAASDMMQYISHDFRTPLSGIYTSLHLLGRAHEPAQRQRYQKRIQLYAQRMERLIDEVMTLTRLDKTDHYLTEDCHLHLILSDVLEAMRPLADTKGITLRFEPPSDLPALRLNIGDCDLALRHVLDNAITYTPSGGMVTLAVKAGNPLTVTVRDTGVGIAPAEKQRIFERFYRGDGARSSESGGAGLGLAIVQRVMERHGGSVILASEPGLGTIVALKFP